MDPFDEFDVAAVAALVTLPPSLAERRTWFAEQVVAAHERVCRFAVRFGWESRMRVFWSRGIEIHATQAGLWRRICELCSLPPGTPAPTPTLAAALEGETLLVIDPARYAQVQPRYAAAAGAYERLLAHEMAHRLHVAILDGDEQAMGPVWFFEGFAVVASDDLVGLEVATPADVWEHVAAEGDGAYAHYAAALRCFMQFVPLHALVRAAGRDDFAGWLRRSLAGGA